MPTNTEIMEACFAAFQRGDVPAILNMFDDNVEVNEPGDPKSIPFGGQWRGKSGVAEFFRIVGDTTQTLKFEPHQYVSSGDRVIESVTHFLSSTKFVN